MSACRQVARSCPQSASQPRKLCGRLDLLGGEVACGGGERLPGGAVAQPGQDFPGGEPAHDLLVLGNADAAEVFAQPALERADLFVHRWQHAAGHEQFPQVPGRPPRLELVERLVRKFDVAVSQPAQQLRRCAGVRWAPVEPAQPGARVLHRDEQFVQWKQLGPDLAGAVVEQRGDPVGQGAAGAEAAGA